MAGVREQAVLRCGIMTPMRLDKILPSSLGVFVQASVTLLADLLEATGKEPAKLAEKIEWQPELFRQQTLAEWLRGKDQTFDECLRVITAVAHSTEVTPDPVELPPDVATSIYGSRPAKGYRPTVPSIVQEVSEEPLDAFGQKQRLAYMSVQSMLDDAARRSSKKREAVVKALKSYAAVAKQLLGTS